MDKKSIRRGMIVRHFKWETLTNEEKANNVYRYRIVCNALHTETGEQLVIYQALYANKQGEYQVFARPLDMFLEKVDKIRNPHIKQEYRFEEDKDYAGNTLLG